MLSPSGISWPYYGLQYFVSKMPDRKEEARTHRTQGGFALAQIKR